MKLTHSTQCLHQQMMDALQKIVRPSISQESQHFINIIPVFKAKDPQSFDDLLEKVNKVATLTNKDPDKLPLAKYHISFSRTISSFPPSMGRSKIKELLCYDFGSVATKQHTVSMLIVQQQKPSETLQEYFPEVLRLTPQVQWSVYTPG